MIKNNPTLKSEKIDIRQIKAARALLAWSQQDLAEKAKLGVSTVADFERGQREPVPASYEAICKALDGAGVKFLAGGAITGPVPPIVLKANQNGNPVRFLDATNLKQWADLRDCQQTLPEVISKIIRAATQFSARLCFPSDENIQNSGWDGTCVVATGTQEIPSGTSGWEIGTQRTKLMQKASDDYEKRTKNPGDILPAESTFVFVTPRSLKGKLKWIKERRAEERWLDVRAYDADDLVHMLELYPAVGHWLAVRLGKRPPNVRQLEEIWNEWSHSTKWPMSSDLILSGRDEQATQILRWLNGQPSVVSLQAESVDEAKAFLYAAIAQLPVAYRDAHLARCLVADNADSARFLGDGISPLIIVLDDNKPGLAKQLSLKGHHVLVALGSGAGAPDEAVRLPRLPPYEMSKLLQEMGVPEPQANSLAKDSARSLSVLRRLIPSAGAAVPPAWATGDAARILTGVLFAGSWDERSAQDRSALEKLTGKKYDDLIAALTPLLAFTDSPLRKAGTAWKIASPRDAWFRLAYQITKSDIDRLEKVALEALETPNPEYDVDPEKRWMSFKVDDDSYSELLRRGIAETLAVMSVYPEQATTVNIKQWPAYLVRKLFENADGRRWWSLSPEIQILVEAAPDALLTAIETSLDSNSQSVMELFMESEGLFGRAHHVQLLWALEMLAWSPRYISRASAILARLAKLDPGGRYSNRPMESLRSIFLPWCPQTSVGLDMRVEVLEKLREVEPVISWNLLLSILPKGHDTVTPSPKPQWLDLPLDPPETVTYALIRKGAEITAGMLMADVGVDVKKWEMLLQRYADFSPTQHEEIISKLRATVVTSKDESLRNTVWTGIRKILNHHRAYPEAKWRMSESELEKLEPIYESLSPTDRVEKISWLFSDYETMLPKPTGKGWQEDQIEVARQRAKAVKAMLISSGVDAVLDLARSVKNPRLVGAAFIDASKSGDNVDILIAKSLQSEDETVINFAIGMVVEGYSSHGVDADQWINSMLDRAKRERWASDAVNRLLVLTAPKKELWERFEEFEPAVSENYWKRLSPYRINDAMEAEFVIEKFLSVNRPHAALTSAGIRPHDISSDLLVRILNEVAVTPPEEVDHNTGTMLQHYVTQILQVLDVRDDLKGDTLAMLEWQYLSLLEHSNRPPHALHQAMASRPEFFVEVLRVIYRPAEGSGIIEEPVDKEEAQARATQAYKLLHSWQSAIPGQTSDGIDETALHAWVSEARRLSNAVGRGDIADEQIGQILAFSPAGNDGIWPALAVRNLLEKVKSEHIERGLIVGVHNGRSPTWRALGEGGVQERAIAANYRQLAIATQLKFPRTSALLNQMADDYEAQAKWHDERVDRDQW